MLVLQKAVKMVWSLREVTRIGYAFMVVMLLWMVLWSFGAAGVLASSKDSKRLPLPFHCSTHQLAHHTDLKLTSLHSIMSSLKHLLLLILGVVFLTTTTILAAADEHHHPHPFGKGKGKPPHKHHPGGGGGGRLLLQNDNDEDDSVVRKPPSPGGHEQPPNFDHKPPHKLAAAAVEFSTMSKDK